MKDYCFEITFTPQHNDPPTRLDRLVRDHLQTHERISISRSDLKHLFEERRILLSGQPASASTPVREGVLRIRILDYTPQNTQKQASPALLAQAAILHEDSDLLILNKPSGLPSVPHSSTETETAVGVALAHCPGLAEIGRNPLEPGLLHRLDTETSGILVFAKTQAEFDRLFMEWKTRRTQKIYRAWTEALSPLPEKLPYSIDLPLGHDLKSSKRMRVATPDQLFRVRGKPLPAHTDLLHAQEIHSPELPQENRYFDLTVQIHTGVMHQIRTHLSALNWPILGDSLYHPLYRTGQAQSTRLWLHAWKLKLPLASGAMRELTAPLPPGWPQGSTS